MSKLQVSLIAAVAAFIGVMPPRAMADNTQGTEISFRTLCFEHRNNVTAVLASGGDAAKIPVPLYTSDFSEVIKARFVNGKAAFYVEEPQPDGRILKKIVAEGPLAQSLNQAFVLVPTDGKDGIVYRIVAFEDGEDAFPMGSTRVLNFSPFPIRLNLAGSVLPPIKPGGNGLFPMVKKVDEWNMYTALIQFGVAQDQWVDVATQSWKASERKRDWVITLYDAETKQPAIRQYKDIPPWRKTVLPAAGAGTPAGKP